MKWHLYDELIKKKFFAKIGVTSPAQKVRDTARDAAKIDTGTLRLEE
jgi:hypothetical protein